MYADFFIINWLIEINPLRAVGDLGEKEVFFPLIFPRSVSIFISSLVLSYEEPHYASLKLSHRAVFKMHSGAFGIYNVIKI